MIKRLAIIAIALGMLGGTSGCIVRTGPGHRHQGVHSSGKHRHQHCHRRGHGKNTMCHNHPHNHPGHH